MSKQHEKELELEYQDVLAFTEAKQALEQTTYSAGQVRGAITSYCNKEGAERPRTFCEMEEFVPDFVDWWLDDNPELHNAKAEGTASTAANRYLAFTTVWKAKHKDHTVENKALARHAAGMMLVKNALGVAMVSVHSHLKRLPESSKEQVARGLEIGFAAGLSMIRGDAELPTGKEVEELGRFIGAYLAGDKSAIEAAQALKQIAA